MEHKPNHGWGVYRLEPWRIAGPFNTRAEAEACQRADKGWRGHICYGEFGVGIDGFTFREKPKEE